MSSAVTKYVTKRILGETMANNFGKEDPYFETVPATRLDGRPSKKGKKRRKALPAGISEHDGKVLTKVKRRAYRLDMSLFNLCGVRFGWGSVIGLIPFIGDSADAILAFMVLRTCHQIEGGLPRDVHLRMLFNIILDFGIGLVPLLGDVADAMYKANTRNAVILEKYLRQKGAKALKAQGSAPPAVDPSDPAEFDRQLREELGPPPAYSGPPAGQRPQGQSQNSSQQPAAHHQAQPQQSGGWFSGFRSKSRQPDVEHGMSTMSTGEQAGPALPARPQ